MDKQEKVVCAAIQYSARDYKNGGFSEPKHICGVDYKFIEIPVAYTSPIRGFATSKNRFVDAKEAMRIAVKTGQYPNYEFRKKVCLHEIEEANENKKHNQENIGFDGQLYVADIGYLDNKIKEYDSLLERDYLKPEDLY